MRWLANHRIRLLTKWLSTVFLKSDRISVAETYFINPKIVDVSAIYYAKNDIITVSTEELMLIANELGVIFEQSYILENGNKLTITNES